MMKSFTVFVHFILVSLAMLGLSVSSVSAAPMYYTFTGTVDFFEDHAGIIADTFGAPVTDIIGDPVEYVYLVDTAEEGYITTNIGTTYLIPDCIASCLPKYEKFYFYAEFVSGSLIGEKDGGYHNGLLKAAEMNYGSVTDRHDSDADKSDLRGESRDESTNVGHSGAIFADWVVGLDGFVGIEEAYDSTGKVSIIFSKLKLTGISSSLNTVPDPAAVSK